MFSDLLDRVLAQVPGAIGAALMGFDGLPVETRAAPAQGVAAADWEAAAIELASVAAQLQRVAERLESGDVSDITVKTEKFTMLIRLVTSEYFIALAIDNAGSFGKARYMLRVVDPQVSAELA